MTPPRNAWPTPDPEMLGREAEAMIAELGAISSEPGRLVRLFLSPEHRRAADLVAGWMRNAGLAVSEDALGTVRGRLGEGPRLLIGSHIDTVIDAGRYDGPLGVIAGILAAKHVIGSGGTVGFGLDVLAFGDEEGSRFPATMTSSSACAGVFEAEALAMSDATGVTLEQALQAYGKDSAQIAEAAYRPGDVAGYVEVHIEQGPVLEREGLALGVVTGIVGQSRLRVAVTGEAGHAGTVPMALRRDALAGAAELALAIETVAREHPDDGMVGTVGRMEVMPGAVNIVPARVNFTIDFRSLSDALRLQALARVHEQGEQIARRRGLSVSFELFHEVATAHCDPAMQARLSAAVESLGSIAPRMPSGAGHDAQIMTRLCPSAMLFVRCKGGVSHNPAEHASPSDMGAAVAALIHLIENFELGPSA